MVRLLRVFSPEFKVRGFLSTVCHKGAEGGAEDHDKVSGLGYTLNGLRRNVSKSEISSLGTGIGVQNLKVDYEKGLFFI